MGNPRGVAEKAIDLTAVPGVPQAGGAVGRSGHDSASNRIEFGIADTGAVAFEHG